MSAPTLSPSDYVGELGAFASTLALAWYWDWQAADLVWGLWLSSLCVGYLVLLARIFKTPAEIMKGVLVLMAGDNEYALRQIAIGVVVMFSIAGFMVAFFTFHFGMFHYFHGALLEGFFPLEGLDYPSGARAFVGFVAVLLSRYYGLVIASAVVQIRHVVKKKGVQHIADPYLAVVKMHLMIFVFAALHGVGATNFLVYAVVLFAFFFPWRLLKHGDAGVAADATP